MDAVIGASGFVGGNLRAKHDFAAQFTSANIDEAAGRAFDTVVCAAAPGSMVAANRTPEHDRALIDNLIASLSQIEARRFVLISSIAVLKDFAGGDDEGADAFQQDLAYGRHRRALEAFCAGHFPRCLVVRLPALYGAGLRKNFLFDLLNPTPSMLTPARAETVFEALAASDAAALRACYAWNETLGMHVLDRAALDAGGCRSVIEAEMLERELSAIGFTHPGSTFQYYGLDRLWTDIGVALEAELDTLHLATEPLQAARLHEAILGAQMPETGARLHREDMHTRHAGLWGREGPYLVDAGTTLDALAAFANAARRAS
ncbi:MAG: hypothetical protein ACI87T_001332 [Planctomycetota bacterium]|jgi:hypothetical protein